MAGSARGMPSDEDIAPRGSRLTLAMVSGVSGSPGASGSPGSPGSPGSTGICGSTGGPIAASSGGGIAAIAAIAAIGGIAAIAAIAEARRLQLEHRPVAAGGGHQLVVGAELDHLAVLEHADAIGVAHGREAMRDQDGGGVAGGGEDAVEDLRLA